MLSLITSYLLQSKECILPGIGVLQIIHTPASTDSANNLLLPPYEAIIFKPGDHPASQGLIKYISAKKVIDQSEAKDLLEDFCTQWKEKINAGERLQLETLGSIHKQTDGAIGFEKEMGFNFLTPVTVNSVYQKAPAPTPVVIEEEALLPEANEEVNEYKEEKVVVERSYWGLWALILLAIAAVMLFYHFKDHKPSASTIGNQNRLVIDSAAAGYQLPK